MSYIPFDKFKNWCTSVSAKFKTHTTQLGGLYFAKDGNGKWGYKTSSTGAVTPFTTRTTHTATYSLGQNNGSKVDMGVDHSYRYINASGLYTKTQYDANYNSGKAAGKTNHTGTYNLGQNNGSKVDMGADHSYRYINASGLYTKTQYDANYNSGYSKGKTDGSANLTHIGTLNTIKDKWWRTDFTISGGPYSTVYAVITVISERLKSDTEPSPATISGWTQVDYTSAHLYNDGGSGISNHVKYATTILKKTNVAANTSVTININANDDRNELTAMFLHG